MANIAADLSEADDLSEMSSRYSRGGDISYDPSERDNNNDFKRKTLLDFIAGPWNSTRYGSGNSSRAAVGAMDPQEDSDTMCKFKCGCGCLCFSLFFAIQQAKQYLFLCLTSFPISKHS